MAEQTDYGTAGQTGLTVTLLDKMWEPLRQAMSDRLIPGASAAVLYKGERLRYAGGLAVDTPDETTAATLETLYDCASLTKVSVTLPLVLILLDQGKLKLEDPVSSYLPEFHRADKSMITLRHLLSHTSGFVASYDFHTQPWTPQEIIDFLSKEPLAYEPGTLCIYSDVGFILLGEIIPRLFGMPLDQAAKKHLFGPLGMKDSGFRPSPGERPRIAATEYSTATEAYWRGIVHDENARAMGGVSGHAGLFATAADLLEYARMWLASANVRPSAAHKPSLLSATAAVRAITKQTPLLPEVNRGLGWVLKGDTADVSGRFFSQQAFGHTGFTGTSLYLDPLQELAVVLLTNRVHYGREQSVTQLRTDFHDAVAAAIQASSL